MATDAPLTYGQLSTWRSIATFARDRLSEVNVPATWDVGGMTTDAVLTALAALADRHESLRTTYHVVDGVPVQRIHPTMAPRIRLVDRDHRDPDDPARTTREVHRHAFPVTDDPGWHGTLVSVAGQPWFLALSLSHMVVDLSAIQELERQFRELVDDPARERGPAPTPRELAALQRGDVWTARRRRADTYWRKLLTTGPLRNLPAPPPGRTSERRIQATLRSHHLAVLVAQTAKARGVSQQSVVMAATASALGVVTDQRRITMSLMSANRFDTHWQSLISTQNQLIPVVCDLDPDETLVRYLKRAHFAAMLAYRSGSYDVDRAQELAGEVGAGDFTHDCWFNHVAEEPRELPTSARVDASATLDWSTPPRHAGHPFYARVHGDGANWLSVTLRVDPDLIPPDAVVRTLRLTADRMLRTVTEPETRLGHLDHSPTLPATVFPTGSATVPLSAGPDR